VAATVPVESAGSGSPLLQQAQRIGLPDEEPEQQKKASVIDPQRGSFEAFMGSFGSPRRWAGT